MQRCDAPPRAGQRMKPRLSLPGRSAASEMTRMRTIDIHTHVLTEEMIGLLQKEAPKVAPRMTAIDADSFVLEIAGTPYRPFPRGGWDLARRFADMRAAEVD